MDILSPPIDQLRNDVDSNARFLLQAEQEMDRLERERYESEVLRTTILPRELTRLRESREAEEVAPWDERAQTLITGQINEVKYLMKAPERIDTAIAYTRSEISKAIARQKKLTAKLRRKERHAERVTG